MKLSQLLARIGKSVQKDREIVDIETDSRKIGKNFLFVATKGTLVDGHQFIGKAVENGAVAVVCHCLPEERSSSVEYIVVEDTIDALGKLVAERYGNPSYALKVVGVTGTNGKTTIATTLYNLFRSLGYKVGLISTICYKVNEKEYPSTHTTPDIISLNRYLSMMVEEGCEYAFMEVSSHSLDQRRVEGVKFSGAIFTNLTRDHLDYHKTTLNYLNAKKKLFDGLEKDAFAISNIDDKSGKVMLQNCNARKCFYSLQTLCDYHALLVEERMDGMLLKMGNNEVEMLFTGRFNVYNLLAVYATAVELGIPSIEVLKEMSKLSPVEGRLQTLHSPRGYVAVIDYAHTPDALKNVLSTLEEIKSKEGRIISVIGAGGNRDKGKRPLMAKEAIQRSQLLILTSDNPRDEEPNDIIQEMLSGLSQEEKQHTLSITLREEAIRTACMMAQRGDIILIAGKGHENYQEIRGVKYPFSDKAKVLEVFTLEGKGCKNV